MGNWENDEKNTGKAGGSNPSDSGGSYSASGREAENAAGFSGSRQGDSGAADGYGRQGGYNPQNGYGGQ